MQGHRRSLGLQLYHRSLGWGMARHWPCFRRLTSTRMQMKWFILKFRRPRVSSTETCQIPRTASPRHRQSSMSTRMLLSANRVMVERTAALHCGAHFPSSQTQMPSRTAHPHRRTPRRMASLIDLRPSRSTSLFRRTHLLLREPQRRWQRRSIFAADLS